MSQQHQQHTVGELMAARQKTLGLTNADVSRAIGIKSPNTISMIKMGHTKLPLSRVAALANLLDINPSQLLCMALKERSMDDFRAIDDILKPDW